MTKAAAQGSGDFVEQVSCELPLQAIAGLMGVPQEERKKMFDWSNQMVGDQDPEFASNDGGCLDRTDHVRHANGGRPGREPGEDIVTKLIQADVEGHKLSDDEFGFFVIMLAVAGNETTSNSITQGMMAFTELPDQWELYKRERPATPPTRSCGGRPRSRHFSGPRWRTPSCPACRSRRVSGW